MSTPDYQKKALRKYYQANKHLWREYAANKAREKKIEAAKSKHTTSVGDKTQTDAGKG